MGGLEHEGAKMCSPALGVSEHYARHTLRVFAIRAFPSDFRALANQTS